jgi:ATP-dependent DNA helicase RecQ
MAVLLALSGTLTMSQKESIPKQLGLKTFALVESSPDKPNIFLEKKRKESCKDVLGEYESIVFPVCDELCEKQESFPVTLLFLPIFYMSEAMMYLRGKLGLSSIHDSIFSAICSGQDEEIINATVNELKKENPKIRLILTTSIAGMGFDPLNVSRIIHACPPRNISQYLQEIGRAGRRGQSAVATLHYGNRDLSKNLPGIQNDIINYCRNDSGCMRNALLSVFGFQKEMFIQGCKCCSNCKIVCTCELCNESVVCNESVQSN